MAKIFKIVLLLLLTVGLYAKGAKWHSLKPLYGYNNSSYVLKEGVAYLELREYTWKSSSLNENAHESFAMSRKPLSSFSKYKVKRFKNLAPILNNKTNIRKFKSCDYYGCLNHIGNGFMIDSNGRLWIMNEIADVWSFIERINTPAKIQLALWLYGKDQGVRYRKVANGYEVITEKYRSSCEKRVEEFFVYSIHVNYNGKVTSQKLLKHTKRNAMCVKKPAIYLYPKKKQYVNVSLKINGNIIKSIPTYNKGWHVMVDTNGTIESKYDYLFYENSLKSIVLPNEGWIKRGDELHTWFDTILPKLGLNSKETREFKEYWLKRLKSNALYEIKLFSRSFLSKNMTLTIDPKPDTLIRVIFNFKKIDKPYKLKEPTITTPKRAGFHVLEWGGVLDSESK